MFPSFFSFLSFSILSFLSSSFLSLSSSSLIILILSSSHAHSLSISFPSLTTNYNPIKNDLTNYNLINNESIKKEKRNITHCMDCICTITTNCTTPPLSELCTKGTSTNPKRCGMFRISYADHSDWEVDGMEKKSPHGCAKNRSCVEKLILDKKPRCGKINLPRGNVGKTIDSCLDHARDVFVGKYSDCEESSPEFDAFLRCYDPSSIPVMGESRLQILYYGLSGSILVIVLVSITVILTIRFRSKKAPQNDGATKEKQKNNGAKESYGKGEENHRNKAMAINQEYFTRYTNQENGNEINCANDDDGSSGFYEFSSPMDSPGSASSYQSREAIPMKPIFPVELNVGSLNVTKTSTIPPPHVFFRHNLSRIEPLKVASGVGHFGSVSSAIYTNEFGNIQKVAIKSLIRYGTFFPSFIFPDFYPPIFPDFHPPIFPRISNFSLKFFRKF